MRQLDDVCANHPLASAWSPATRAHYRAFAQRLLQHAALDVQVGKGGLSFYLPASSKRIFVCHFNAAPRGDRSDLGFADFRGDTLQQYLDLPATVDALQHALGDEIPLNVGKIWHSLHFPLTDADRVADAFAMHVVAPLEALIATSRVPPATGSR